MTSPRRLSEVELALEYFYSRTYRAQYRLRIGTVGLVAVAGLHFGFLTAWTAAAWVTAFLAVEATIVRWWRGVNPQLGRMDPPAARRRQHQMTFFCGLSTSTAVAPFLVGVAPTTAGVAVSVLFSAGVIMLVAAQQSMTRSMFLWTVPLPALALVRNVMWLADGSDAYLMGGLAVLFVFNARQLQLSNATAEARLVEGQVEAQRANDAKRDFLATVSHEIRTPLNGVIGMTQAMAADALSPVQAERLNVVHRSALALQALLNDVLDLSKIEAGRLELEVCDFDLMEQIRLATDPFAAVVRAKGVELRLEMPDGAGRVRGDPHRLRQVLTNLVSNAVKFTRAGSVVVSVHWVTTGVRIDVEDTGVGLAPETAGRIFDRFVQAEAGTSRQFGGSGLGLAICRELATLMGGEVNVRSEPGVGSCFSLELPLERSSSPPPPRVEETMAEAAFDGLRVLVAEDNPTNQLVLRHLLGGLGGVVVEFADTGVAALHAFDRAPWDVILMDINMPEMDGVQATLEIRRRERAQGRPRTPILALTANAMAHQAPAYLAAGMDRVIAKPVIAADLLRTTVEVLSHAGEGGDAVAARA